MAAAPLYKRYIPPTTRGATYIKPPTVPVASIPTPPQEAPKRKRERTEDEVAERKAKKFRKKGIDPPAPTAPISAVTVIEQHAERATKDPAPSQVVATQEEVAAKLLAVEVAKANAAKEAAGDFSHIKNVKKRHKLEKEARKIRKAGSRNETNAEDHDAIPEAPAEGAVVASSAVSEPGVYSNANVKVSQAQDEDGDVAAATLEAKPKKRRKKDLTTETALETADEQIVQAIIVPEEASAAVPADVELAIPTQLKKRRHKLEAALKSGNTNVSSEKVVLDSEDQVRLSKHSGVLDKFQRAASRSDKGQQDAPDASDAATSAPVLRDLIPLPQPEATEPAPFDPDYSALPPWLARPTIFPSDSRASFVDLQIAPATSAQLSELGFSDALPVQQALIPLLLPPGSSGASFLTGTEPVLPDIAVSAATGSGKTLAYLLPIIESLRRSHGQGRLTALIVVPTRELVLQVAAVAESLAKGSGITVGSATGTGKLKDEQEQLIRQTQRYDSETYQHTISEAHLRNYPPEVVSENFHAYNEAVMQQDVRNDQRIRDAISGLVDHIPIYESNVDLLVCTPGRLLEHMRTTLGFDVTYLQWLILDEADKLLDQQYDGFLATLNAALARERTPEERQAREVYLRAHGLWDQYRERRVRKVVLSATMTNDISKLMDLKLRRPKMVIVRGKEQDHNEETEDTTGGHERTKEGADSFELPPRLIEYCVPVKEVGDKPLYLVEVLGSKILPTHLTTSADKEIHADAEDSSDSDSSDSDASSVLSDSSSESSAESSIDSSSATEAGSGLIGGPSDDPSDAPAMHPSRAVLLMSNGGRPLAVPTVLIFASSNESATRLSHLLRELKPGWAPWIECLTKAKPASTSRRHTDLALPTIVVATDRAARGIDTLSGRPITHVIQYDVPRSLTGYIHRVGRTARAGHSGEAWTLYAHKEARWFLHEVTLATNVKRGVVVEKVKFDQVGEEQGLRQKYVETLESMREEVHGGAES